MNFFELKKKKEEIKAIEKEILKNGWQSHKNREQTYIRVTKLQDFFKDLQKNAKVLASKPHKKTLNKWRESGEKKISHSTHSLKALKTVDISRGSISTMGAPDVVSTPKGGDRHLICGNNAIDILDNLHSDRISISLGLDCEWSNYETSGGTRRHCISTQISCVVGCCLYEYVFFNGSSDDLMSLKDVLSVVLSDIYRLSKEYNFKTFDKKDFYRLKVYTGGGYELVKPTDFTISYKSICYPFFKGDDDGKYTHDMSVYTYWVVRQVIDLLKGYADNNRLKYYMNGKYDFRDIVLSFFDDNDYMVIRDYVTLKEVKGEMVENHWFESVIPCRMCLEDVMESNLPLVFSESAYKRVISFTPDAERKERDWIWGIPCYDFAGVGEDYKFDIQLITHTGKVDLSMFRDISFRWLTEVQGGVITLTPFLQDFYNLNHNLKNPQIFLARMHVRDTMAQSVSNRRSLEALGDVLGIPKISDKLIDKSDMEGLLKKHPRLFMEYACRDSTVTLLYYSRLYGYNRIGDVTLTSVSSKVIKQNIIEYMGINNSDFDRVFRGLKKYRKGLAEKDGSFLNAKKLEPINLDTKLVQDFSCNAYHGGYNISSYIGWIDSFTQDYDLKNAYLTAMPIVPDIDWDNPIHQEIVERPFDLSYFRFGFENPFIPFVGYVTFEFPADVKYPSIPISCDGNLVYPRTSDGMDGVFLCGPELYLALKLGAKIYCKRGFILNTRFIEGKQSHSLGYGVKKFVTDRELAKEYFGKKSFEEMVVKTLGNASYGKISQNVSPKRSWSSFRQDMEDLGCSSVTNPFAACMITSIVRAELIATLNEVHNSGYTGYSATTDGFISDVPYDVLESFDMYGMKSYIRQSRVFLTGDDTVWEVKHKQDCFLNLTTRGNMGLTDDSVSAHNSTKSGFKKDSYDDRLWFITNSLSRTSRVSYNEKQFTTFKDMSQGSAFDVRNVVRQVSMDFDLKRKPVKDSFTTVYPEIESKTYEICNFDTIPYENIGEFLKYRDNKTKCDVLRTYSDWEKFFSYFKVRPAKAKDMDWSVLWSVVAGHRHGLWTVDELNSDMKVYEKIDFINTHNTTSKRFKESDWKNCRRAERVSGILPITFLTDKLHEFGAYKLVDGNKQYF